MISSSFMSVIKLWKWSFPHFMEMTWKNYLFNIFTQVFIVFYRCVKIKMRPECYAGLMPIVSKLHHHKFEYPVEKTDVSRGNINSGRGLKRGFNPRPVFLLILTLETKNPVNLLWNKQDSFMSILQQLFGKNFFWGVVDNHTSIVEL